MNKVAVITGASKGLGQAIADKLYEKGFFLALCSRSIFPSGSGERMTSQVDISNPAEVGRFVDDVIRLWGRIDVLVNNAGYASSLHPLEEMLDFELLQSFQVNVFGPFYFMSKLIPIMQKQEGGGIIINIASRAALRPVPKLAVYSASKAALKAMTVAAAKELRVKVEGNNVWCYTVCPGGINTQLRATLFDQEDAEDQQDPKKVADVVAAIASSSVHFTQGRIFIVTKEKVVDYTPEDEEKLLGL